MSSLLIDSVSRNGSIKKLWWKFHYFLTDDAREYGDEDDSDNEDNVLDIVTLYGENHRNFVSNHLVRMLRDREDEDGAMVSTSSTATNKNTTIEELYYRTQENFDSTTGSRFGVHEDEIKYYLKLNRIGARGRIEGRQLGDIRNTQNFVILHSDDIDVTYYVLRNMPEVLKTYS